jgi:ribonuclease M5
MNDPFNRIRVSRAIVVEGRDDVDAVSKACEALIIATHGFGITAETWKVLEKAHNEKGLLILTDPDHAGEEIRKRLNAKFPGSVNCYIERREATAGDDIGIENSSPDIIAKAVVRALELAGRNEADEAPAQDEVSMDDLTELGLAGCSGSAGRRAAVCGRLGIGYGNARAMLRKLKGFGIGPDELRKAVKETE